MECVIHLTKEAGTDLTARMLYSPFSEYCESDKQRAEKILRYADELPDLYANFITPAIMDGFKINCEDYIFSAIDLVVHQNIEIRKNAIFCIGRIEYNKQEKMH